MGNLDACARTKMKWKRVPNSWYRTSEGTTAIVRGDPGNDKKTFIVYIPY